MDTIIRWETNFFNLTFALYVVSTLLYFFYLLGSRERTGKLATGAAFGGLICHTVALVLRTVEAGRAPLSNQFEFANVFAWGIVLCYLFLEWRHNFRYRIFGSTIMPFAFIVIGYASLLPKDIRPLMPALQSVWLKIHVGTAILAYGAFTIGCGIALVYLYRNSREKRGNVGHILQKFPGLAELDELTYKVVAFGFLFQTLVIVTGAIWAEQAWGRYWGWDPKETWSFITWIVYAVFLHTRFTRGWAGKKTAWFAIIGFICVLFTYIGVNMFLPGLHSYQ